MSDATTTVDQAELASDAQFTDMLQKMSFQPGILLGANALTTEQSYHVRRLNRHQRWLVGPGTVFGLRVDVMTPVAPDDTTDTRITVSPGYAIDGLGREVMVSEAYAISLRDWLAAENAASAPLAPYDGGVLYLRVTVRAQACPNQLQPVVAELFDAGLDPVVPALVGDSFALEISTDALETGKTGDVPAPPLTVWSPDHITPSATQLPGTVTAREQAMLATLAAGSAAANTLNLQAWLLQRPFPPYDDSPGAQLGYAEAARLLLASVHVTLPSLTAAPSAATTAVNNLVRPFIRPNILLAAQALP